jgi:hypothetical protein
LIIGSAEGEWVIVNGEFIHHSPFTIHHRQTADKKGVAEDKNYSKNF